MMPLTKAAKRQQSCDRFIAHIVPIVRS